MDGRLDGTIDGCEEGCVDGKLDGAIDGWEVGCMLGQLEGCEVGLGVALATECNTKNQTAHRNSKTMKRRIVMQQFVQRGELALHFTFRSRTDGRVGMSLPSSRMFLLPLQGPFTDTRPCLI